ncbi:phosphotransferase enzyme family protein [Penicillium hispanicum]|uniref:phosphotransferase enzyme family protein n=1 Tax=Penicillium hispanicum TaxID=1080232 RepID=UPI002540EA10|nr:phosphotransferase enzyme family protein [Penicillium hispanicum]KAJ5585240.1 phosphotransferase enzyme family protein [Penicillium hispanicum]
MGPIAPYLVRLGSYSALTLRYPNLSLSNILLAPGLTKIIGIIDWQDAVKGYLDIDPEGGTELDNYRRAIEGNQQFYIEIVRQSGVDQQEICWRNWPYKDAEDNSMPPFRDS